jgi:hypothetical protein
LSDRLANVDRANHLLRAAWRSGILPEPRNEAGALETVALRGRGPAAFGEVDHWREPFERLVSAIRDEAGLNPLGRTMAHAQLVMLLRSRIRAAKLWRRHPEILTSPIAPPVIILGQMRSGTTRMQRLLACDPRFAFTRTHESLTPVPMAGRKLRARSIIAGLRALNPETLRIHPTGPSQPEEEFGWLSFGFGAAQFEAQWRVPAFSHWWEQADARPLYREFKALLHTNAWARGEDSAKPWVLKAPYFLQDIPALLDTFPGARLVCVHRDMAKVVASSASLVWNQMRIQSDSADKAWIGREWLRKTKLREERASAALGGAPAVHVDYDAMTSDWRFEMSRVYDHLGLQLAPSLADRMDASLTSARHHLGHRYSLDQFGLSAADVRDWAPAPPRTETA